MPEGDSPNEKNPKHQHKSLRETICLTKVNDFFHKKTGLPLYDRNMTILRQLFGISSL
jgi:hypothetical protein